MILRRRPALLVFGALTLGASLASAQPLPPDVLPDQYELRLTFDLQHDTFAGSEQILVNVVKPTTRITLNAAGLTFRQVTIVSGWTSQPATVSIDERRETASFTVRRRLAAGPARIRIEYGGRLGTQPRGLFVGRADGRKFAASQFEPTDARRAFPCFDQPDMKASFLVTVVAPAADVVISNGRVLSDMPGPEADQHTVKFATTRKMSTYLVAVAVGDFDCLATGFEPLPVRVCALQGRQGLAQFAAQAAPSFLRFYNAYFGVPYPFSKLDLVALPDFPGGMENVGAIFFGERDLLVDPQTAPVARQKQVATTLAHEMAHQWIGDLVTMKWWDDLWLKEGFATFFETRPIQPWRPDWHIEIDEVASAEQAMAVDQLQATHAARLALTTPAEINDAYDPIVYQKAGAVLRMVEAAMGREAFRAGVNAFLRRFAYSNATAEDFRSVMAENSTRAVDQILRTFIEQPGVPVVTFAARCVTDATSSLTVSQQRFGIDPKHEGASAPLWAIPVSTRPIAPQPGVPPASVNRVFSVREQAFDLAGCSPLVLGNAEAVGYFRTRYAPDVLAELAKDPTTRLTPAERLRLLDDQWAFAHTEGIDVGEYLALVAGYASEDNVQIVDRMEETLRVVRDNVTTDADRDAFQSWLRRAVPAVAARLDASDRADPLAALNDALSARVAPADVDDLLDAALRNAAARPTAWAFVKGHWSAFAEKMGADEAANEVLKAASGFCDPAMRDEVKALFGGAGLGGRALTQTLQQIQACVDFRGAQRERLARWLAVSAPRPPGFSPRSTATDGPARR